MMRPPAPIDIEPREKARFSAGERFAILLRQSTDGISRCDACDDVVAILSPDGHWMAQKVHEFDHGHARALGGKTHRENGRALCKIPCHLDKSRTDVAMISKSDAQGGRTGQYARRRERKARCEK